MNKILLLFYVVTFSQSCIQTAATGGQSLDNKTFQDKMKDTMAIVLDVRTPDEYQQGHIPHATLINFYDEDFKAELDKLDKDKTYLVYCNAGGRASKTSKIMKEKGFKNVFNLEHGFKKWNGAVEK